MKHNKIKDDIGTKINPDIELKIENSDTPSAF